MLVRFARLAAVILCAALGMAVGPIVAHADDSVRPVLVIGGFNGDAGRLEVLRAWLGARGYPAYVMELSGSPTGTASIVESAQAVAAKVGEIRQATGAQRVDLIGHSMGGLAQRWFVKFLGGIDQVGTYVDYGTPEQGEPLGKLCAEVSAGCRDLAPGSDFVNQLNADPAISAGVPAYHLFSENGTGEKNPLPGATNASVQSFCPGRSVDHAVEPIDPAFQQLIDSALRGGPLTTTCP
ncbi:alpha/beta hydrolase [Nocardia sp. NPDC051030]|uniref:esterase/lipase family protein n=1 Tax=Nocardia sp. NPDC051030 TaxID=3155162 RepID=UPI0034282D4F